MVLSICKLGKKKAREAGDSIKPRVMQSEPWVCMRQTSNEPVKRATDHALSPVSQAGNADPATNHGLTPVALCCRPLRELKTTTQQQDPTFWCRNDMVASRNDMVAS